MSINGEALNDAGWVLHDELQKLMGQVPAKVFNNLKPALEAAIVKYMARCSDEKVIDAIQSELDVPRAIAERAFRKGYRKFEIAAEEREKELNRMVATVSMLDKGWARKVCASLYDAGYRKFEIVEEDV